MAEEYEDKVSIDTDPAVKALKELADQTDKFARDMNTRLNSLKSGFDKVETSAKSALGPFKALGAEGANAVKTLAQAEDKLAQSIRQAEVAARQQSQTTAKQVDSQTQLKASVDKSTAANTAQMVSIDKLRAGAARLAPEFQKLSDLQLAMMSGTAPLVSSINDLARITGTSANSIAAWGNAIEVTGGDVNLLGRELTEVEELMKQANQGNAQASELFRQLGVATNDATGQMRNSLFVMRDLGESVKKLQADTKNLSKTKLDASASMNTWAGSVRGATGTVQGFLGSISNLKGGLLGLAASLGVLTFKQWAEEASAYGQEVVNLSRETGIAIPVITGLEGVMRKNNVSFQEFALLMRSLSRQMLEADDATSQAALRFEALGISVKDKATGEMRDLFDVVVDIANAFEKFNDNPVKTANLGAVLGNTRAASRLLPLFSEGGDKLRAEVEQAKQLGDALNTLDTEKLDDLNNKLDGVGKAWDDMKRHMVVANKDGIEASARSIEGLIRTLDHLLSKKDLLIAMLNPLGALALKLKPGEETAASNKAPGVTGGGTTPGGAKDEKVDAPNLLKLAPDQTANIQRGKQAIIELKDAQLAANLAMIGSSQKLKDQQFKIIDEVLQANIQAINERGEAEGTEQGKILASQRAFNNARIQADIDAVNKQIALTKQRNVQERAELTDRLTSEANKLKDKGDTTGAGVILGGVLPAQLAAMKASQAAKITELETTKALTQATKDLGNAEAERAERGLALELKKIEQKTALIAIEHTAAAQQARDQVLVATGIKTEVEAAEQQLSRERELSSARIGIANEELGKLAGNDVEYAQKKAEVEQTIVDDVQRFSTEELRIHGLKNKTRLQEEVTTADSIAKLRTAQARNIEAQGPAAGAPQAIGQLNEAAEAARFEAEQARLKDSLEKRQIIQAQYDTQLEAATVEHSTNLLTIRKKASTDVLTMLEQDAQSQVNIEKLKMQDLQVSLAGRTKMAAQEVNVIEAETKAYEVSVERRLAAGERLSQAEISQNLASLERRRADAADRASDSFTGEYFRGLKRFATETTSTFNLATQLAQNTANNMTNSFQTLFFDAMQGKFHSFQDIATSVMTQIQQMSANLLANLATKGIFEGVAGATGDGGLLSQLGGAATSLGTKALNAVGGRTSGQKQEDLGAQIVKDTQADVKLTEAGTGLATSATDLSASASSVTAGGEASSVAGGVLQTVGAALGIVPPLQITAATTTATTLTSAAAALLASAAALTTAAAALSAQAAAGAAKGALGSLGSLGGAAAGGKTANTGGHLNLSGILHRFGGGGNVPFSNGDSVDAKLTPGEFVVRRSAVEHYGTDFMHKLNQQKFNTGGLVPASWISTRHSGVRGYAEGGEVEGMSNTKAARSVAGLSPKAGGPVTVNMNISTPDASSFRKSRTQVMGELRAAIGHAARNS